MLSYLRLLANPASDTDFLRIINVPARGIGQKTVAQLLDLSAENATSLSDTLKYALADRSLSAGALKKLQTFSDLMEELRATLNELSPSEILERTLRETRYQALLEKEDTAEADARLQNLAELVGSLREYEAEAPQTGEEVSLAGYLERVSLVAAVDTLQDAPKVSLMTVHSSKGLEFERVWITGMEEETFPFRGLDGDDPEELDEERRLAYVAITRARHKLTITHAGTRFLFGKTKYLSRSRFLDDIPADSVELSGESRPHFPGLGGFGSLGRSDGFGSLGRSDGFGSPGRARQEGASQGGRVSARQITVPRSGDAIDEIPDDDYHQPSYDQEGIVIVPGQRVLHKKFGRGIVERVETGGQPTVVARFPGYGPKRIIAEYLEFE